MSPGAQSISNHINETKKTDLEVTAVLNSLNTEDVLLLFVIFFNYSRHINDPFQNNFQMFDSSLLIM